MNRFDWRGMTAFVLGLGVAIALVAGFLAAELSPGAITQEEVALLSTLGGAAIGAVAAYMGVMHVGAPPAPPPTIAPDPPPEGGNVETTPERDEPLEPSPTPPPDEAPPPAPPDEESDQQQQVEPTPPESEEEELEAMTGGEDPADL